MSDENLCITPKRKKCKIYRSKLDRINFGCKLITYFNFESCHALVGYFNRHKTRVSTGNISFRRCAYQNICNNCNVSGFRFDNHSFNKHTAKDQVLDYDTSIYVSQIYCDYCISGILNNCSTTIWHLNSSRLASQSSPLNVTNVFNKCVGDEKYVATLNRIVSPPHKYSFSTKNVSQNFKCDIPLYCTQEKQNSKSEMRSDEVTLAASPFFPADIRSSGTVSSQQTTSQQGKIKKGQHDTNVNRSCILQKHCFIYNSSRDKVETKTKMTNTMKVNSKVRNLDLGYSRSKKTLPDFFPVRRSVRKTKRVVQEEINKSLERAIIEGREEYLQIKNFSGKGRGVIALRTFEKGEFVVEYVGELITVAEANQREKKYVLDKNAGCYMFYFKFRNRQYCIDATLESDKMGRLINHSRNGNLITKVIDVEKQPRLVLFAKDNIQPGEELSYDYGDRSKESLLHHPWLAL